jgi:ABC-type iron transport system FetAB ATPase subunit
MLEESAENSLGTETAGWQLPEHWLLIRAFLILDEATSAPDSESETIIRRILRRIVASFSTG